MENIALQEGQSVFADPSAPFTVSVPSFGVRTDGALDAEGNFRDGWPTQRRQPIRHPPASRKRSWSALVRRSEVILAAKVLWASTWSIWGLGVGAVGLLTGGGVRKRGRILEFWGGILPLFLKYFPFIAGSPVATFGHVVLGRCERYLDACRPHQLIHVKQYECWGPLFVPTYLTMGFAMWCCGKRPYYDNPFEREAFQQTI